MKPIFSNLFNNNNNSKSYRPKKKQIYNMNNISNPFFNNSQIKLQKNSKIKKREYFSPKDLTTYLKTFSTNNFRKKDSFFMESIRDFAKHTKYKPIEEYSKNTEDLMGKYTYSNPRADSEDIIHYETEMTRTKANYFNKKKDDIKNYLNKSKKMIDYQQQKAFIKFNETEFKDPIDSLGLILKNKTIHDKVLNNYQNREMQSFGSNIGKYNRIKEIINLSKNVKITSIMPKAFEKEFREQENTKNEIEGKILDLNKKEIKNSKIIIDNDNKENDIDNPIISNNKNVFKINGLSSGDLAKGSVFLLTGYYQSTKICPESREQFSFNYEPITNCIYLFSGNSCYYGNQQLWRFNLLTYNWEQIKPSTQLMDGRSGHTGIIYKSKLIIFGGRYLNNTALADVDIYNIDTNKWTIGQLNTSIFLKLRRNHVACLVGQQMFIHGGLDEFGEYLDDSYLLNLSNNYRWYKANITSYVPFPKLGYHSCCLVVSKEIQKNPKFSIYKFPEITINTINSQIREKGIYIFGGKKSDLKDPSNKLWLLKIGRKPLEWCEIKTKGKPPCPRYLCSMNYYELGNFIIIHGGKTKSLRSENILKDTYLFDLFKFEWIKVNYGCFESMIKPRFSHAGIIYQKKLIIFGGVNEQGFNGSNFFLIKLETEDNPEIFQKKKKSEIKKYLLTLKPIKNTSDDEEYDEKDHKNENKKNNIEPITNSIKKSNLLNSLKVKK
jgi:hypothetical protein